MPQQILLGMGHLDGVQGHCSLSRKAPIVGINLLLLTDIGYLIVLWERVLLTSN